MEDGHNDLKMKTTKKGGHRRIVNEYPNKLSIYKENTSSITSHRQTWIRCTAARNGFQIIATAIKAPNTAPHELETKEAEAAPEVVVVGADEVEEVVDEIVREVIFVTEAVLLSVADPVPVVLAVVVPVRVDVPVPLDVVLPVVVLFPAEPTSWPFPSRYLGGALYNEGSLKTPIPYGTPLGSVRGAETEDPSVALIRKRPVQRGGVKSSGEVNW